MKKLTKAILVLTLALAAGALWLGTHDCEAPCGLIEPLDEKIPPPDLNAYVAYVAATNAVREWPEAGEAKPTQERKTALVATNAEALALMREASTRSEWCDTAFRVDCLNGFFSPFDFARMLHMMCWDLEAQIALGRRAEALESIRAMALFAVTMRRGAESFFAWRCADSAVQKAMTFASEFANARHVRQMMTLRCSLCFCARSRMPSRNGTRFAWLRDARRSGGASSRSGRLKSPCRAIRYWHATHICRIERGASITT
jgi:hypothetical protein